MTEFTQPAVNLDAFHCPNCGSYSDQSWTNVIRTGQYVNSVNANNFMVGHCRRCRDITIWKEENMIYPSTGNAPMPNPDMTDEIKIDYNEARDIISRSPRSACVLLRLCIEKICNEKKATGKDLNEKIKKLAEQGLEDRMIKALDSVRVIGGQAVHPLEMDLRDDVNTATKLFEIVNYISDWAHTRGKIIDDIFDSLPDGKKEAIKKRDS